MTHTRRDLAAWHRRCSDDYRARALRDEHGHSGMLTEVAARHAATARLLERDGKRMARTKPSRTTNT